MALPASMRFSVRRDIVRVLRNGRRLRTPLGRISIAPAALPGRGRILFIVPTAVSKKSNQRNRIKRRLDEWARSRGQALNLGRWDVVMLVGGEAVSLPTRSLWRLAGQSFSRLAPSNRL